MPKDRELATPEEAVLAAFGLASTPIRPAASGLINRTWHVRSLRGEPRILQRLNAVFPPEINRDIDALTRHLAAKGMPTPRVVPSRTGALWFEHADAVWRVLTRVDGVTRDALESAGQAREAGRVLAEFHRALADFEHTFSNARLGVHDTARHLRALRSALEHHANHSQHAAVLALAGRVLALAERLPPLPAATDRIVHGDPKVSNIVFEHGTDRGVCLIDLDTLTRMPVALELGDALRSWCNPATEDAADTRFSEPLFAAAIEGYATAARGSLERAEWCAIPAATLTVTVELAARFCADALAEQYFGWDDTRYASASEHNQARARGQLRVADEILAGLGALDVAVEHAFAR
jgi:Ser/Thr protein kinase RdoA (MazF antagonist)